MRRRSFLRRAAAGAAGPSACAAALTTAVAASGSPAFTFGVVADVQYADYEARGTRFYRQSIAKLAECVERFNALRPDFVVQLGDLIDGNFANFDAILGVYNKLSMPHYHVLGNHDLPNESQRTRVLSKLAIDQLGHGKGYYDFGHAGWRFVVIDGNDIDPKDVKPRTSRGGLQAKQLAWMEQTLADAAARQERSIVLCHYPLFGPPGLVMSNAEAIFAVLKSSPGVAAYMSGHRHEGGYELRDGIHCLNFRGMVETEKTTAYALVEVFSDQLRIRGFGREPSRVLKVKRL